ncbi:MAG: hypothetical protein NTW86_02980 [Candidatus Sumerlaeota bacterium]|nr:hypothetical protein [Candidatus Sumerlaeota bacterium]
MPLRGHVEHGVVVLDEAVSLPEGSLVHVEPVDAEEEMESLRRGLRMLAGSVKNLPPDMAARHDFYLHGARE